MRIQITKKSSDLWFLFVLVAILALMSQATVFAGDNKIAFTGKITQIETSSTSTKLTVSLLKPPSSNVQVTVLVNGFTELKGPGDVTLPMTSLSSGQFIAVEGVFTSAGIAASQVEVEAEPAVQNEFRIRGTVDSVDTSGGTTSLTIGGVTVSVPSTTQVDMRNDNELKTAITNLSAGLQVDIEGTIQNGQLVASQIEIGDKLEDNVDLDFHGTVTATNGDKISVQIAKKPSITVDVTITSQTRTQGTIAVGSDVEVQGRMSGDFSIVADKIEVAGAMEDEAEQNDANQNQVKNEREIQLTPTTSAPMGAQGSAEIEFETEEGQADQKLKVDVRGLGAGTSFSVQVSFGGGFVSVGSLMTDPQGRGEFQLHCTATCNGFPTGKDVRDITSVQVVDGAGNPVLTGSAGAAQSPPPAAPQNFDKEIQLTATSNAPGAEGEADIEAENEEGQASQRLRVKVENLMANSSFTVLASFGGSPTSVGSIMTDDMGRGELELRCDSMCTGPLAGNDVHNLTMIQVVSSSNMTMVFLQGSF
jgi:uncharacterized protein DUF5666